MLERHYGNIFSNFLKGVLIHAKFHLKVTKFEIIGKTWTKFRQLKVQE